MIPFSTRASWSGVHKGRTLPRAFLKLDLRCTVVVGSTRLCGSTWVMKCALRRMARWAANRGQERSGERPWLVAAGDPRSARLQPKVPARRALTEQCYSLRATRLARMAISCGRRKPAAFALARAKPPAIEHTHTQVPGDHGDQSLDYIWTSVASEMQHRHRFRRGLRRLVLLM